jgi:O-antigen ligase
LAILPFLRISLIFAIAGYVVDKQTKLVNSPLNWLLLMLLFHCVVSAFNAYNSGYAFDKIDIITIWVVIYFLVTGIVNSERRLFLFLLVYFLANFKMSQFGFFSWVSRGFGFASWGITGAGWFRNSGELGLQMSMFFAYTICFVYFLRSYWTGWVKWLMYFLPLSAVSCVIASSSRGALIAVVAVLLYLSMFSKKRFRAWLGTAAVLFVGYLVMPAEFLARFQNAGKDPTSLSRMTYWEHAREMLNAHPFTGIGYYNWQPYYHDHYFDPTLYWRVEEAHNTFLQMGAELGYVGLILFVLMVLYSFVVNRRSARLCKEQGFQFLHCFAVGMNAAGVGMVVASLFLTAFFMPNYWMHFAFTVCLDNIVKKKMQALGHEARPASPAMGLKPLGLAGGRVGLVQPDLPRQK